VTAPWRRGNGSGCGDSAGRRAAGTGSGCWGWNRGPARPESAAARLRWTEPGRRGPERRAAGIGTGAVTALSGARPESGTARGCGDSAGRARRDERFARCFGRADRSARQINVSIDGDGMPSACRDELSGHKLSQDRWSTVAFGASDAVLFRLGLIEASSHFHRTRTDQPSSRNSA
jgi:hypothetical protein